MPNSKKIWDGLSRPYREGRKIFLLDVRDTIGALLSGLIVIRALKL
jgi:hypothetical protein